MTSLKSFALLVCAAALSACGDSPVQTIDQVATGARVKFFNFGINAPGVNFYANTTKMTGILTSTGVESTTGVIYTAAGNGGLYETIVPGSYTLATKIAATADHDLTVASVTANLEDGKYYSYFVSGFYNTTAKTADAFLLEDPFVTKIDFDKAYVRFVNAVPNSAPMTLYAKNANTTDLEIAVGGLVAYKNGGAFTAVPVGVYDLSTRVAGASANVVTRTGVSFAAGRVYTIAARGDFTVGGTTAATRIALDNTANR